MHGSCPVLSVAMNDLHAELVYKHLVKRVVDAMISPTSPTWLYEPTLAALLPTATPKKPAATLKAKATALPLPSGNDAATADENDGDDAAEKNPEPVRAAMLEKTEVDASGKD